MWKNKKRKKNLKFLKFWKGRIIRFKLLTRHLKYIYFFAQAIFNIRKKIKSHIITIIFIKLTQKLS